MKLYMGLVNNNYIKNIRIILDNKGKDYVLSGNPVEIIEIKDSIQCFNFKTKIYICNTKKFNLKRIH